MATSSTKKTRQKPAPRGITWEGAERPPAKRWWWFLGFGYVSLVGVLVTISLDNWTFAAVLVVASIALVVTYLGKPHHVQARLTQSELTVNKQAFPLVNYRSFRIDRDDAGLQMRLAAQQATVATGDAKQINKMIDYASGKNATDGTDAKELNNMANALESSPNTPSYIQPANLETMRLNGTDSHKLGGADSLIKGALRDGVYSSADKLASTGRQEMGVVSEVAKTMASSPNKQDTDAVLALHEAAKTATTDSRIAPRLGKQKTVVENLASGDTSRW